MPLYKIITVGNDTKVLIWKIEESYELLCEDIVLTPHCQGRVNSMKSEVHRRGFMSIRHLLAVEGYTDHDLFYDEFGKPHLADGKHISITHSFEFSGIIISTKKIGIDIEKQRDKIQIIAHKFVTERERIFLEERKRDLIKGLTIIWGAKESLYKLYATPGLGFKEHIAITSMSEEVPTLEGAIHYKNKTSRYTMSYLEFEGYTCVYVTSILEG